MRMSRLLLLLLLTMFASGLVYAVLSLPEHATGLQNMAAENMNVSGVSQPVTAVLLNFRGYDTLLEMAVLFLALLGVWSLGVKYKHRAPAADDVLNVFSKLLIPLLVLVAGYLLWVGSHAPGGAFQAGSLLAASGVLLLLSGWQPGFRSAGLVLRIAVVLGLLVFVVVALAVQLLGWRMLEFPPAAAGALIVLIEVAATVSIGITLTSLFYGRGPQADQEDQPDIGANK